MIAASASALVELLEEVEVELVLNALVGPYVMLLVVLPVLPEEEVEVLAGVAANVGLCVTGRGASVGAGGAGNSGSTGSTLGVVGVGVGTTVGDSEVAVGTHVGVISSCVGTHVGELVALEGEFEISGIVVGTGTRIVGTVVSNGLLSTVVGDVVGDPGTLPPP